MCRVFVYRHIGEHVSATAPFVPNRLTQVRNLPAVMPRAERDLCRIGRETRHPTEAEVRVVRGSVFGICPKQIRKLGHWQPSVEARAAHDHTAHLLLS